MSIVRLTEPLAFRAGVNVSPLASAKVALIAAVVPVITIELVPLPVTSPEAIPPVTSVFTFKIPAGTERVT